MSSALPPPGPGKREGGSERTSEQASERASNRAREQKSLPGRNRSGMRNLSVATTILRRSRGSAGVARAHRPAPTFPGSSNPGRALLGPALAAEPAADPPGWDHPPLGWAAKLNGVGITEMHCHDASLHDVSDYSWHLHVDLKKGSRKAIQLCCQHPAQPPGSVRLITFEPETTVSRAYIPAVMVMLLLLLPSRSRCRPIQGHAITRAEAFFLCIFAPKFGNVHL